MLRICSVALLILCLSSVALAVAPTAYVVNSMGETLSKIDLKTGQVTNDIVVLGSDVDCSPNQVIVRDTLAYVLNSETDEIQRIDLRTETTVDFIDLGAGSNPYWMEFYNDRYLYVTRLWTNSLAKVDVVTGTVVAEDSVGKSPGGLVIYDHKAYIGITAMDDEYMYGQGRLAVYDCRADSVIKTFDVGTNPNNLAVDRDGRIHVVCTGDYYSTWGIVYVIDPDGDVIEDSLYLGGSPGMITIGPDNIAYLAAGGWYGDDGYMYAYDAGTLQVLYNETHPLVVAKGCMGAVAFQDSSVWSVGFYDTVEITDTSGAAAELYAVGDGPVHLGFNYVAGDISGDFMVDIGDLTILIDMLFISLNEPEYLKWRANVDGNFNVDMGDLTCMIEHLFITPSFKLRLGPTWLD